MRNFILLGISFLLVISPAYAVKKPLNEKKCAVNNWYSIGYKLGSSGKAYKKFRKRFKGCARTNIKFYSQRYTRGWKAGMKNYCTDEKAYDLGAQGRKYPMMACADDAKVALKKSWENGLYEYCVPEVAYVLGEEGHPMPEYCPKDVREAFVASYNKGVANQQKEG